MTHALNKLSISNHFVLPDFVWEDIPQLVLLTGVNGSGKTKLLESINLKVLGKQGAFIIDIDCALDEREFGYIPWQQNLGGFERGFYANMQNDLDNFVNQARINKIAPNRDQNLWKIMLLLQDRLGETPQGKTEEYYRSKTFVEAFRTAWAYSQDVTLNKYISRLFVNYKIRHDERIISGYDSSSGSSIPEIDIIADIGVAPWELINDLFEKYNFKYRINSPRTSHAHYDVRFTRYDDEAVEVTFEGLSSGEQMIVTLILWSFNEELGELKKLLILDEPDAHLHPEMALMFKEILFDVLVKKFGIQVVLTTHSPTTLCWFPEENIFLMDRQLGIVKSSRAEALKKLTSGLVFVQEAFRIVLVEDEDDRRFHQSVYDALIYSNQILPEHRLIFKPVSTGGVNSGGKSNVINACLQWSNYTDQTNVSGLIYGLVDKDNDDNSSLPINVLCLNRYCHENYLADPLVVFTLLVQERLQRVVEYAEGIGYVRGEELKFKSSQIDGVQSVSDFMIQNLLDVEGSNVMQEDLEDIVLCEYVNGSAVNLPKFLLEQSGKDFVLPLQRQTFPDKQSSINLNKLLDQMIKTHFIPIDLKDIYVRLAS